MDLPKSRSDGPAFVLQIQRRPSSQNVISQFHDNALSRSGHERVSSANSSISSTLSPTSSFSSSNSGSEELDKSQLSKSGSGPISNSTIGKLGMALEGSDLTIFGIDTNPDAPTIPRKQYSISNLKVTEPNVNLNVNPNVNLNDDNNAKGNNKIKMTTSSSISNIQSSESASQASSVNHSFASLSEYNAELSASLNRASPKISTWSLISSKSSPHVSSSSIASSVSTSAVPYGSTDKIDRADAAMSLQRRHSTSATPGSAYTKSSTGNLPRRHSTVISHANYFKNSASSLINLPSDSTSTIAPTRKVYTCANCKVSPIPGLYRYKCTKCPSFNVCVE